MTDEDFLIIHKVGQLKNALTLDLQPKTNENNKTYSA